MFIGSFYEKNCANATDAGDNFTERDPDSLVFRPERKVFMKSPLVLSAERLKSLVSDELL